MSSMNTMLTTIRDAIAGNAAVKVWTQANYSKDHKVFVGMDTRDPPGESDCPFVVLIPYHKMAGENAETIIHQFYCYFGIYDDDTRSGLASNITEYEGIQNIESFRALVLAAINSAITMARITEVETGNEPIEAFPIFLQDMMLTIEEPTDFGDTFVE